MNNNILKKGQNNQTDLALELFLTNIANKNMEATQENNTFYNSPIQGVQMHSKFYESGKIKETIIRVTSEQGACLLGKPMGTYVTLEGNILKENDGDIQEPFVKLLYKHIENYIENAKKIFVIGLGNRGVTPDALGPMVIDNLYVTRHLLKEGIVKNVREISALAPGVMAQTGMEIQTIIKALVSEIKPDVIIAIDALCAGEVDRLNTTIQLCDTGIEPGAGVGNRRIRLNKETLGVKVIAIGIPTVISVLTILQSILEREFQIDGRNISEECQEKENSIIKDLLLKYDTMFVTTKDIDEIIKRLSYTISEAINKLLTVMD